MNLATVGTNWITAQFIEAAKEAGFTLYAVCSRSGEKARALADKYGAPKAYADYEALLADAAVGAVYIALPVSLHYPYMMQAIRAGKHVICEKSFTSNLGELRAVRRAGEARGVLVFEAITTLYLPNFARIRQGLEEIGPAHLARIDMSVISSRFSRLKAGELDNVFLPAYSGGALMDMGVYCVHFAVGLFGAPERVLSTADARRCGVDISGAVLLQYPGLCCALTYSKECSSSGLSEVLGERGRLCVRGSVGRCVQVSRTLGDETEDISLPQHKNHMVYEAARFLRAMGEGDAAFARAAFEESERVMAVLDAARAQAGIVFPADENPPGQAD